MSNDDGKRNDPPDELPHDDALRALYRQLPAEEPPAYLDDAILAAARRETAAKPRAVPWVNRWRVPLAAAASMLLATLLLYQLPVEKTVWPEADVVVEAASPATDAPPMVVAEAAPEPAAVPAGKPPAPAALARKKEAMVVMPAPAAPAASAAGAAAPVVAKGEIAAEADVDDRALAQNALPDRAIAVQEDAARDAALSAEREARSERMAESAALAADARVTKQAAPAAAAASATVPRGAPWPFGLLPTLAPATACARITQDSGGTCSGRVVDGVLELRVQPTDVEWLPRLQTALSDLGWQEDTAAAGAVHYSRQTTAGVETFGWTTAANGALTLRLVPARR